MHKGTRAWHVHIGIGEDSNVEEQTQWQANRRTHPTTHPLAHLPTRSLYQKEAKNRNLSPKLTPDSMNGDDLLRLGQHEGGEG